MGITATVGLPSPSPRPSPSQPQVRTPPTGGVIYYGDNCYCGAAQPQPQPQAQPSPSPALAPGVFRTMWILIGDRHSHKTQSHCDCVTWGMSVSGVLWSPQAHSLQVTQSNSAAGGTGMEDRLLGRGEKELINKGTVYRREGVSLSTV